MAKNNSIKGIFLFLALIAAVALQQMGLLDLGNENTPAHQAPKTAVKPNKNNEVDSKDETTIMQQLQSNRLVYTKHARCRMDCRTISEAEVKDILKNGEINHRKSKPQDVPCGSYAVEGFTKDKQEVRIVFAACDDVTKVITTIDLGNKYNCHCE